MNISKLVNNLIDTEVLVEADYDMPENIVDNFIDDQTAKGNIQPQENAPNDNSGNEQQPQSNQQNVNQPDNEDQNQENKDYTDSNDYSYDMGDIPDDYDPKDDIPKLKILNTLSDKEYKLSNVKCFDQFKELYKNVNDTLNIKIMNMVTKSAKQRQIVSIVHNNLSNMLDDLDNYMMFKFGDIYEDNIIAYITYLKRYQIAMKIIRLIVDENIKNSNSDKK